MSRRCSPVDKFMRDLEAAIAQNLSEYVHGLQDGAAPVPGIPPQMFKKLLSLCHPDKHGNSETSQEVTRWLLAQRRK